MIEISATGLLGREGEHFEAELELVTAANAALALGMPLLVTGAPGSGKTDFAFAVARWMATVDRAGGLDAREWEPTAPAHGLLECYIRSDTRAKDLLYTYDAVRRFGDAHHGDPDEQAQVRDARQYIELEALGRALASPRRRVLLIDEIDKAPRDLPNDLLRELDQGQFAIPEVPADADDRYGAYAGDGPALERLMGERDRPIERRPFIVICRRRCNGSGRPRRWRPTRPPRLLLGQLRAVLPRGVPLQEAREQSQRQRRAAPREVEPSPEVFALQRHLEADTWRPRPACTFDIYDPKPRRISAADFRDRVLHHALCAELEPTLERFAIADSFACRRGKGMRAAIRRVQRFARQCVEPGWNCRTANRNARHPGNRNDNVGLRPVSARYSPEARRLRTPRPCTGRDHGLRACAGRLSGRRPTAGVGPSVGPASAPFRWWPS